MADEVAERPEDFPTNLALDSRKQKEFEDKVKTISSKFDQLTPGVIYLGHLPHGFFEDQLRQFFSQFGTVTKVRVSRSKKTGGVKGYAFVEFAISEVAKIAADTMNNYLMFGKLLKCRFVPKEKVHPKLWIGADRQFKGIPANDREIQKKNRNKTEQEHVKQIDNIVRKERQKRKKMKKLGIDYDFPGYDAEVKTKRAKQTTVDYDKQEEQKHEKKIDNIVRKEGKKRKKMKKDAEVKAKRTKQTRVDHDKLEET